MKNENEHLKKKLTSLESACIGSIAGLVAATTYMPFWTIKMRYQSNMPLSLHPLILYKGFGTILSFIIPVKAIQIFNTSRVESLTSGSTITPEQRTLSAFVGGASSALLTSPLNLTITQQHKHKYSSPKIAAQTLMNQHGKSKILVGLPTHAMGEGLYTLAYYAMVPLVKPYMKGYFNSELAATLAAGILVGLPTAIVTHPLDRIKTMQHLRADEKDALGNKHSAVRCIKDLIKNDGIWKGMFKGLIPRGAGIVALTVAAGTTAEVAETTYRKYLTK